MLLNDLQHAVTSHTGTFACEALDDASITRTVAFTHQVQPAQARDDLPDLPGLQDFYSTFGGVLFYADAGSGEAAILIAPVEHWPQLRQHFDGWTDGIDEDERREYLPEWVDTALVIGEEPRTGNYLLMPTTGLHAGAVFLFDHDGFEFTEQADDIVSYVWKLLDPDDQALSTMAAHMRFIDDTSPHQWWICELRDNRGNVARTQA